MLYGTKNISRVGTKFADLPRAYLVASVRVPYARAARAFFTSRVYLHSWIPVKAIGRFSVTARVLCGRFCDVFRPVFSTGAVYTKYSLECTITVSTQEWNFEH